LNIEPLPHALAQRRDGEGRGRAGAEANNHAVLDRRDGSLRGEAL
jgi:hypothetical protein